MSKNKNKNKNKNNFKKDSEVKSVELEEVVDQTTETPELKEVVEPTVEIDETTSEKPIIEEDAQVFKREQSVDELINDESAIMIANLNSGLKVAKNSLSILKDENDQLLKIKNQYDETFEEISVVLEEQDKEITDLTEENTKLKAEVDEFKEKIETIRDDVEKNLVSDAIIQGNEVRKETVKKAKIEAEQIVADAKIEAERLVNEANKKANAESSRIMNAAKQKADLEEERYNNTNAKLIDSSEQLKLLAEGATELLKQNKMDATEISEFRKQSARKMKSDQEALLNKEKAEALQHIKENVSDQWAETGLKKNNSSIEVSIASKKIDGFLKKGSKK